MKNAKKITVKVFQFENGDTIVAKDFGLYYVKNSDTVQSYSWGEMKEIYGEAFTNIADKIN